MVVVVVLYGSFGMYRGGAAAEIFAGNVQLFQSFFYERQHTQELREYQGFMVANIFGDLPGQLIEFDGGIGITVRFVENSRGVADLPQLHQTLKDGQL